MITVGDAVIYSNGTRYFTGVVAERRSAKVVTVQTTPGQVRTVNVKFLRTV